ncbi:hypothetical protein ASG37_14175 [Sphingomonas sp. Leaf407]|nr:hypothetical protein ASE97_13430 [Sphingomonas sp. Leaf42]KQT26364.1 hypothetical protein ASG37_14175 [Sphingomonas sp. Leaf407]
MFRGATVALTNRSNRSRLMTEQPDRFLSRERRLTALSLAAMVGVIVNLAFDYARAVIVSTGQNGIADALPPAFWAFYIAFGSLIAVPVCLVIGMPLWYFAERAGWRSRHKAIQLGTLAGAIISFGFVLLAGPQQLVRAGYAGLWEVAGFCIAGAAGGLVAHFVASGVDR